MITDLEFLSTTDKPALLGLNTPQYVEAAKATLASLNYKVHWALNHGDFITRFTRVPYQMVLLEERFDATSRAQNLTLENLQVMPMNQRRHAIVLLLGDSFETMNVMQAFGHSVHAVVNPADLGKLTQVVQQIVSDNDIFLNVYREAALRVAQGKV